jgi:multidrug efflux pump subunit AcrA (membrane-fusion protein)
MKRRRTIVWTIGAVTLCLLVGALAAALRKSPTASAGDIPTTIVKRGDLEINVFTTGELRARHSEIMTAPPIGGGLLEITKLLQTGTRVKKGDLVMEFDPSEQEYKVEQSRSELLQADQEITKAKADAAVVTAKDKVELLKARFDVRRAELDVQKNELVSAIDARKNDLALEQARRVLAEVEQDVQSRTASGKATIVLAEEKRIKSKLAMEQAQENIRKMRVVAPIDGLVALEKNDRSAGGMFFGGMTLPEYRQGDKVDAGATVGKVIDPGEIECVAKLVELDRNNVKEGQAVDIDLDALHGPLLHGKVKSLGGNADRGGWGFDNNGTKFEATISLDRGDSRLRPGFTAQVIIHGDSRKNVLYLPLQAVATKESKRVVFVKNGSSFEPREVKIDGQSESRVAVEGVVAGTEVAMIDPTAPRKSTNSGTEVPGGGGQP